MSLFGFGNIEFGPDGREGFGPLSALENNPEFQRENFRYPLDVGAFDKGHYMMFYIREQKKTGMTGLTADNSVPIPGLFANGFEPGAIDYYNAKTGSEIGSALSSGANQIKSATGDLGGSFTSKISSFTGAGGKLGGFDTGSISSSLNSIGTKVKGGLNSIFGQTALLKASPTSTSSTLDTSIGKISNNRIINTTQRTKESIALYMPDTLMYNHTQTYASVSGGKGAAAAVIQAGRAAMDKFRKNGQDTSDFKSTIAKTAAAITESGALKTARDTTLLGITKGVGKTLGLNENVAGQAIMGMIQNPMLEMTYTAPNFRKFQFDFFFYPRDEAEALQVQNILDRFKYHQAPEFGTGVNQFTAATLRPPSEFDIKFYYGSSQNPNIPALADGCVLETIDVNYAPNGAQFYEVPGENIASRGRTGMPVGVQLTLNFTETTVLTKKDLRDPSSGGKK